MGFFSFLGDLIGKVCSIAAPIVGAIFPPAAPVLKAIAVIAPKIGPALDVISNVSNVVGKVVGVLSGVGTPMEELGARMTVADKKREDFESYSDYLDYLDTVETPSIEFSEEQVLANKVNGYILGTEVVAEKTGFRIEPESIPTFTKLCTTTFGDMSGKEISDMFKTFADNGLPSMKTVGDYLTGNLSEKLNSVEESFDKAMKSLGFDDVDAKFDEMQSALKTAQVPGNE